jgi:large exoprotein involved in heme utilization and adhesion
MGLPSVHKPAPDTTTGEEGDAPTERRQPRGDVMGVDNQGGTELNSVDAANTMVAQSQASNTGGPSFTALATERIAEQNKDEIDYYVKWADIPEGL